LPQDRGLAELSSLLGITVLEGAGKRRELHADPRVALREQRRAFVELNDLYKKPANLEIRSASAL
jgi:hypothetical protein